MGVLFNADEVFEMAIQTEENGAAFYRRAAELHPDGEEVKFLLGLAEIEDGHKETFQVMRADLAKSEKRESVYDPYEEAAQYLDAVADGSGGEGSPKVVDSLTGQESMKDILKTAIELEKNSILFYLGLLELVPERLGQEKVTGIIKEERAHVVALVGELRKQAL
jgi:rubrerythrin